MLSAVWYAIRKTENPFSAAETVRIVAFTAIKGGTLVPQKEYIIRKLKERGCRITRQRLIILDIILQEDCSCCKEIYYKASRQDTKIGFATVYRMVNMLEEIGAISRKNMYKVACEELCENGSCEAEKKKAANSCIVELSDRTTYCLSAEKLDAVFQAGLKACGYIEDQEIKKIAWNSDMCCAR